MLVSIVIPVHKTTPFLKECVLSALHQTYPKIEVILICNGNLSITECDTFLNISDSRILFATSEKGRHHARNKGMEIAKGEYFQFLDFDDLLSSTKIERQILAIKNHKFMADISITKWNIFYKEIINSESVNLDYLFEKETLSGLELYKILGKNKGYIMTASWLFSRKIISKNIQWEDVPNDDALFASEIINQETTIVTVPEILTSYRNHESNTRSIRTKEELNKLIYSWEKIRANLAFKDVLVERYFYNAYFYILKYSINCKGYRFFKIYKTYKKLSKKAKIPLKIKREKDFLLFKKYFRLVLKKIK